MSKIRNISGASMLAVLMSTVMISDTMARDCVSCQTARNGGITVISPGGYYPGGNYYPGGVHPGYGSHYPGYRQYPHYGSGSITHTCASGNKGGGGCVTSYQGPASDIRYLPRIDQQIRRTQPGPRMKSPW
jgi:hypothetical protein